jgi:hypothetical protein
MANSPFPASQLSSLTIDGDDFIATGDVSYTREQSTQERQPDAHTRIPQFKLANMPGSLEVTLKTGKTAAAWAAMVALRQKPIEMSFLSGRKITISDATQSTGPDGVKQNTTSGESDPITFSFSTSVDTGAP